MNADQVACDDVTDLIAHRLEVEVVRRVAADAEVEQRVAAAYQEGHKVGYAEGVQRAVVHVDSTRRASWPAEWNIGRRDGAPVVARQEAAPLVRRVLAGNQMERR